MLFRQLDRIKRTAIMSTIIFMFIGFIFLVLPEAYIPMVSSTLAFCLLVVLAVSIMDFISSSRTLLQYIYLALGLLAGLVDPDRSVLLPAGLRRRGVLESMDGQHPGHYAGDWRNPDVLRCGQCAAADLALADPRYG